MNHYERNRKAVQQGLSRRAARRADAAMDAQERAAREELNRITAERRQKIEAAEAEQCRQRQIEIRHAARKAKRTAQLRSFLIRAYGSLAVAAAVCILLSVAAVVPWLAITGVIMASVYFLANLVAYTTRNVKRRNQV